MILSLPICLIGQGLNMDFLIGFLVRYSNSNYLPWYITAEFVSALFIHSHLLLEMNDCFLVEQVQKWTKSGQFWWSRSLLLSSSLFNQILQPKPWTINRYWMVMVTVLTFHVNFTFHSIRVSNDQCVARKYDLRWFKLDFEFKFWLFCTHEHIRIRKHDKNETRRNGTYGLNMRTQHAYNTTALCFFL